jgi:hypothetical protein
MPLAAEKICEQVVEIAWFGEVNSLLGFSLLVHLLFMFFLHVHFLFLVQFLQLFGVGQVGVLEHYLI